MAAGKPWIVCVGLLAAVNARAEVIPLACPDGRCEWVRPAGSPPCVLILGSLSSPQQTFRISLHSEPAEARPYVFRDQGLDERELPDSSKQLDNWRRFRLTPETYVPRAEPPRRKMFHLFTAERDLEKAANYEQVAAELCGVGKRIQVYLDARDPLTAELDRAVADVIRTFDQEVHPWSRQKLGQVVDIDRDGRFTVLFSNSLSRLQGGKSTVDGFVRGSDFLLSVPAPFSNHCDMMYLNARLRAGPHLRTVVAHEYTHAVNFSEHVLNNPAGSQVDEESWLNEGLAHVVEDLHQHGWSNLDYRVRGYLAQPERYPLLVADYYGSGLWRTPGTRGCSFLFLRWCHMRTGAEMPKRLIQSPFVGVRNLENATRQPFARLYREWAVSLITDESWRQEKVLPDCVTRPRDLKAVTPTMIFGPSFDTLNESVREFKLVGTGLKFVLLPGTATNQHFTLQAERDARLQATLVEVDAKRGLLDVHCRALADHNALLIETKALGSPVRVEGVFWEKTPPQGMGREGTDYRELPGGHVIGVGEKWVATLTDFLPGDRNQDLVIRVVGKDALGRLTVGCGFVPAMRAK